MILGFKSLRNICVDTHVHRISNRLGWVKTKLPDETEQALYKATDSRWWPYINLYLVTVGAERLPSDRPAVRGLRHRRRLPKNWGSPKERTMRRGILTIVVVAAAVVTLSAQAAKPPARPAPSAPANAPKSPGAGPVFVVETVKGTFEVETYPNEAPKTVDHIVALIKRNFYNGQRILRSSRISSCSSAIRRRAT
jgi:hypothetical protein